MTSLPELFILQSSGSVPAQLSRDHLLVWLDNLADPHSGQQTVLWLLLCQMWMLFNTKLSPRTVCKSGKKKLVTNAPLSHAWCIANVNNVHTFLCVLPCSSICFMLMRMIIIWTVICQARYTVKNARVWASKFMAEEKGPPRFCDGFTDEPC